MRVLICIFAAATLFAATNVEAAVGWYEDFGRAQQIAAQTGKPLLLHFWKHGCDPCVRMEQAVFPHPDVERAIQAGYIPVKINANQSPSLARRFNVQTLPTDVVVSPSGQVLAKSGFPKSPAAYVAQLQQFSGATGASRQVAYGSTQGDRWSATSDTAEPYSSAAPLTQTSPWNVPAGRQQPYGAAQQPGSRYQAGSDSRNNAAPWNAAKRDGGQSPGYATHVPSGSNFAPQSPYDRLRQQQPPQVARPNVSAPASPQQRPSPGNPPWNQQRPAPAWNGSSPGVSPPQFAQPSRPYGNVSPGGQTAQPNIARGGQPYADQHQSQRYGQQPSRGGTLNNGPQGASRPRPDMSRFALEGHCVVTLQEQQTLHPSQRRWTPGDERWGARHEGRVYLFAGPDEHRKFLANPNRYAPVLQGHDAVLALDRQQMIPGQRRHGVYYEGRIYLFANESTLQHFSTNPRRYDPRALQAVKPQGGLRR